MASAATPMSGVSSKWDDRFPRDGDSEPETDTDTDSICSSIINRRSFHCFDDSSDDDGPDMIEDWDEVRERSGRNAFSLFEQLVRLDLFLVSVICGAPMAGIFLALIITKFINVEEFVFLVLNWEDAVGKLIREKFFLWIASDQDSETKLQSLCKQYAAHPLGRAAICLVVLAALSAIAYHHWSSTIRQFPRRLQYQVLFSITFVVSTELLWLLEYMSFDTWLTLLTGGSHWLLSFPLYDAAISIGGLAVWNDIPIPWKGTEPHLSSYPFFYLETRRWIDTSVLGVRLKGRKVALWEWYKIWYYGSILVSIAHSAAIHLTFSRLKKQLLTFEIMSMTKNDAFGVLNVLNNGLQCGKDDFRDMRLTPEDVAGFVTASFVWIRAQFGRWGWGG